MQGIVRARPDVDLCVSAVDPFSPVRAVAPVFWTEPPRGTGDYAGWVLRTALERGVDILVAQRARTVIAERLAGFAAAGVVAQVPAAAEVLDLLDDKAAFYADLAGDPHVCPSIAVDSADAFEQAVRRVTAEGASACVKPARGIYGAGYWTLDAGDSLAHLADPDTRRIAPAMFAAGLRAAEDRGQTFALLVMEHLPGLEASVDIVAQDGAILLAAVRTKLDANRQRIQTAHPLTAHAAVLIRRYALQGAVNVQYRQDRRGGWRVLEINTRPAGGACYADAVGIPFSATWIDQVLGVAESFAGQVDREVLVTVEAIPSGLFAPRPNSALPRDGAGG